MVDVLDGKYTGPMTPSQTIYQFEFRISTHLSIINLMKESPNTGWEVYGTEEWHRWAVNGYREGIRHIKEKNPSIFATLLKFVVQLFRR